MRLTVLGCSGTYAGPGQACSGYLVESGGTKVLVDAGPGTFSELQKYTDVRALDAMFLSHSHPDHWVEAPVMRNALRYVVVSEGLPVYSTDETLGLITDVCHERVEPTYLMHSIGDGAEVRVGGITVRASRTQHPPETLGFCLDDGTSRIAYSADTGADWGFGEFGGQVDLGICEATFREGTEVASTGRDVHMTALDAGAMAKAAATRQLMITHLLPGADVAGAVAEAESAYGAAVRVAEGGLLIDL
ncbi:MAG: MBL fold metallo-hydrolase [Actinomycetia bacterium]|nr:MBL fold metallo-hydrolase [Actinomycetes bacterium]